MDVTRVRRKIWWRVFVQVFNPQVKVLTWHKLLSAGLRTPEGTDTSVHLFISPGTLWSAVSYSSVFLVQAGWWTRRMTTAMPSTSQASASLHQRRLSSWSTASFRGEKPRRRSSRRSGKEEKSSETLLHKFLIWMSLRRQSDSLLACAAFDHMPTAGFDLPCDAGLGRYPCQSGDLHTNQMINLTVNQHINNIGPYKQSNFCL